MKLIRKQGLSLLIVVTLLFIMMPVIPVHAATTYGTELITNGGAESGNISGWNDDTGQGRWSSSATYLDWAKPVAGNNFFFLYNPSMDNPLSGTMSQQISLSGTEGSGLFSDISAGKVAIQFSANMYQKIGTDNEAKVILEEYGADGSLIKTSQVVNTTSVVGSMGTYKINTQVNPATRKFKVILSATLTRGGYAQFDNVSLKLVNASTKSAPVFGDNFPTNAETDASVPYTTNFGITDADSGDIDNLTFSGSSTNINLVSASNISVTGTGNNRTLKVVPSGNLSGEADITVVASDGTKSSEKTFHFIVHKVISMNTNLVENGDGTSGLAGWSGNTVNVKATSGGFITNDPNSSMSQNIDISKFSPVIDGGETEFLMSSAFPSSYGKVSAQFYTDIACTNLVGNSFEITSSTTSIQKNIPSNAKGVKVTLSNTSGNYNDITVKNISFKIVNNFPKIAAVSNKTANLIQNTVPVNVYYTTASATLTASSSNQDIISNSNIIVTGSGFNRNITFTPKSAGNVTITLNLNDGSKTVSSSFLVTCFEDARVTNVTCPSAGFYTNGSNLDFTVKFNTAILGGTGSKLPLIIGGKSVTASYISSTEDSITYHYTINSDDNGKVVIGSTIDDTSSPITNKNGDTAQVGVPSVESGIAVLQSPKVTSVNSTGGFIYGTKTNLVATIDYSESLSGSIQFKANGVDIGQTVSINGNTASCEVLLGAGTTDITAEFIPSSNNFYFTSITSETYPVTINRRAIVITPDATEKVYGTGDSALKYQITSGNLAGEDSLVGSLSRTSGEDVGEYDITQGTIKNENNPNYDITFINGIKFKVTPIVNSTVDKDTFSFDKKPASQADVQATITWGSATKVSDVKAGGLSIGADNYSVIGNTLIIKKSYLANQNIGNLELTVVFDKGDSIKINVDVSLVKVQPKESTGAEVKILGTNTLTYGSKLSDLKLNTIEAVFVEDGKTTAIPGTLTWSTPDLVPKAGATKATWKFTPNDITSYLEVTGELDINVSKATPNVVSPTFGGVTYSTTQKLSDIAIKGTDASWVVGGVNQAVNGIWNWKITDTVPSAGSNEYVAVFTPTETDNYNTVETNITVTVEKALDPPNKPSNNSVSTFPYSLYTNVKDVPLPANWVWSTDDKDKLLVDGTEVNATAVYNGQDKGNYKNETLTITLKRLEIVKVQPKENTGAEVEILGTNTLTYGSKLSDLKLNTIEAVFVEDGKTIAIPGTLTWSTPDLVPKAGTTKATWKFTPNDSTNYLEVTGEVSINVVKAKNAPNMPELAKNVSYDIKTASEVSVPEGWSFSSEDKNKALVAGETVVVTAVYTGTDAGNYETESTQISITRAKADTNTEPAKTGENNNIAIVLLNLSLASIFMGISFVGVSKKKK